MMLINCRDCGRNHLRESMVPDPDGPPRRLCPVVYRGFRLTPHDRATFEQLMWAAFATDALGIEFSC
jgi:hypothetical protein